MDVVVEYLDKPLLLTSSSFVLLERDSLVLTCKTYGSGNLKYQWYRDDKKLPNENVLLIISNILREHQGNYSCVASNHIENKTSNIEQLIVKYIDQPIIHKQNDTDNLTFECISSGNPPLTYRWYHLGKLVSNKSKLFLKNIPATYIANYVCMVKNEIGELSASTTANQEYLNSPKLTISPASQYFYEGNAFVLTCDVVASKPVYYAWYKNDEKISGTHSMLILNKISRFDDGNYRCHASNGRGTKSSNVIVPNIIYLDLPVLTPSIAIKDIMEHMDLTIECKTSSHPNETSFTWTYQNKVMSNTALLVLPKVSVEDSGTYNCKVDNGKMVKQSDTSITVNYLRQPFIEAHPSFEIKEKNSLVLTCFVEANLPTSFVWYKNNMTLTGETRKEMEFDSVTRENSGIYSCSISNRFGYKRSEDVALNVFYLDNPSITQEPSNQMLMENDSIILNCNATSYPQSSFLWTKNGNFIKYGYMLQLFNLSLQDSAKYDCLVDNGNETKQVSKQVDVHYLRTPILLVFPDKKSIYEKDNILFTCSSKSNLQIKYSWYKDNRALDIWNKTHPHQLMILDVHRNDSGAYKCIIENSVGSREASIDITVQFLDEAVIKPSWPVIHENRNITLHCQVNSSSLPIYSWYFNNNLIGNQSSLNLTNINVHQKGTYYCKVTLNELVQNTEVNLLVEYLRNPYLSISPSDIVNENGSVYFTCRANASNNVKYYWYKDGDMLQNETKSVFSIFNLNYYHSGLYHCLTENQYGITMSNEISFLVSYVTQPNLSHKSPLIKKAGESVMISCYSFGTGNISYSWYFNNTLHSTSQNLSFTSLVKSNTGIWKCQVDNSRVIKSEEIDLTVLYLGDPFIISTPLLPTVNEGNLLLLKCDVEKTTAKISISWYHNNEKLQNKNSNVLVLENINRWQAGFYICNMETYFISLNSTATNVFVNYLDDPIIKPKNPFVKLGDSIEMICSTNSSESVVNYDWYFNNTIVGRSAIYSLSQTNLQNHGEYRCVVKTQVLKREETSFLTIQYLDTPILEITPSLRPLEGESLLLSCIVKGTPPFSIKWFFSNIFIPGTQSTNIINNIRRTQAGLYSCIVENIFGTKQSNKVEVQVRYLDTPTIVRKELSEDSVQLRCDTSGYPKPSYRWLKDGIKISSEQVYVAEKINSTEIANYQCIVTNEVGEASSSTSSSKHFLKSATIFVEPSLNLNEKEAVIFRCEAEGTLPINYFWYKNNEIITGEDKNLLILNDLNRNDNGSYHCKVLNDAGSRNTPSRYLNVFYMDPLVTSPSPLLEDIFYRNNISINCETTSFPIPSCQWSKENSTISMSSNLVINQIEMKQNGRYICSCTNGRFTQNAGVDIKVNYIFAPIVASPMPKQVIVSQMVILNCVRNSSTQSKDIKYSWQKNGDPIKESSSQLLFDNISRYDAGLYSCITENRFQKVESEVYNLDVYYMDPIEIVSNKTILNPKDSLNISCFSNAHPSPNYVWLKDKIMISNENILSLENAWIDDAGIYECFVKNQVGEISKSIEIFFQYLFEPHVEISPSNSLIEGASAFLTCATNGTKPIKYIWFKNNIQILHSEESFILNNLRRTDSGSYHCAVENVFGKSAANMSTLEVQYLDKPSIIRVVTGDILNLTCSTQGTWPIYYSWFADGKRISNGSSVTLFYNGTYNVNYRCLVTNLIGSKSADTTGAADYLTSVDLLFHPSNIINERGAVTLHCNADGTRPITFKWYKGNTLLTQEKDSVLVLRDIHRSDEGFYQCVASNNAGSKRTIKSFLSIDYINLPLTNSTAAVSIKKGKYFVLSCMVFAKPSNAKITWWKEGLLYSNTSLLTFRRIDEFNSGEYFCVAKNTAGEKRTKIEISVLYLYEPHLTSSSSNTTNEGDMVIFLCNTTGTTPIAYQWYKNSKILNATGNILRLQYITRKDTGQYYCVTTNLYGELSSNIIPLNVAYIERPILLPPKEIYERYSKIVITCTSTASPYPMYSWFKNTKFFSYGNQLIIPSANIDDSAVFECEATNGLKSIREGISLKIEYIDQPVVDFLPSNISKENDFVVVSCEVKSSESIVYEWYKNGSLLPWKQEKQIINDVRRTDSGVYQCIAVTKFGRNSSRENQFTVQYLDEPQIRKSLLSNSTMFLQCVIDGFPKPNQTWYKDDVIISHDANVTINNIIGNETHKYQCTVENLIGQLSVATTTAKDYLSKPMVSVFPSPILTRGSSFVLKCSVDATPPYQFMWKKGSHILSESSDILVRNNLRKNDHDSYSCSVSNAAGTKESRSLNIAITYMDEPVITHTETLQGNRQLISLDCNVDAYPPAVYMWMKDNEVLHKSKFFELSNSIINGSGKYQCVTSNDVKNMTSSVNIYLKYLYKPKIEIFPKTSLKEGDSFVLSCHVIASQPIIYQWFKNGIPIKENGAKLERVNVSVEDLGIYKCECSNDLTKETSNGFQVDISYIRTPNINIGGGKEIYEGETKFIECSAEGDPKPVYRWVKDGNILSYKPVLQLDNIKNTNAGVYSCIANNYGGEHSQNIDVFVNYLHRPSLSITGNIWILVGSIISVSCKVDSSQLSQVTYKWYKNDQLLPNIKSRDFVLKNAKTTDTGVYKCSGKLHTIEKTSESFLNLTVREPIGTLAPVCNYNQVLSKGDNGIVYCACADGFYGKDCMKQSKSLEGTATIIEICQLTFCMNSKEAYTKMTTYGQQHDFKLQFEKQLLENLRAEMGNESVISVRIVNVKFKFILKLDYMIYFDSELMESNIIQIQNKLSMAEVKNYVNTRSLGGKMWFRVTPNSMKLKDFNHCASSSTVCDENADCLNGDMMYHCRCREKYYGNGKICYPLSSLTPSSGSSKADNTNDCDSKLYETLVAVLGGILAFVCVILCCCFIVVFIRRKRKEEQEENEKIQYPKELYTPRSSGKRLSSAKLTSASDSEFEFTSRNSVGFYDPESLSNNIEESLGRFNKIFEDTNI